MSRPHRNRKRGKPCPSGKVRSSSLEASRLRQPIQADGKTTAHYRCPLCRGWHWTKELPPS